MSRSKLITIRQLTSKAGKIGGKSRMKSLSAKERTELARSGGLAGGRARAEKLPEWRRSAIAKGAAVARWRGRQDPTTAARSPGRRIWKVLPPDNGQPELPFYAHLRRIIGEFQHLLRFPTVDVAEMCKRAGDELWDLVKQPAELEFPLKFSQDLRQLTGKGCSEAHLIVHSVLYAVMCAILEDRDPDYRRREIALPGAGSFELFLREDAPKQWTKAELQKKLTLLRKAATAAETLLAALGTDRSSDYLKSVSAYASTVSYAPVLIEALCDCVEAVARRHQTTMRWFRDLRDANLALLAVHVRQCTGRFHWELLANLIDPWTVKCETVTADVLRLRFQRVPRSALQQAELSEPIKPSA